MIVAAEIEKMSVAEKIQAMELLWCSISSSPENIPSPAWHKEVLMDRLTKLESGKAEFLTIDQLKQRLNKPTQ